VECEKNMKACLLAVALALSCGASAADALGTVTILEGQALIYRGLGRVQAAEGVRLAAGDIVETAAATIAQVELLDRSVVQIGPSTRLMLVAATARQKNERALYLLDGWLKSMSTKRDSAAGPGFELRAPSFEIPAGAAVTVLHATPAEVRLFVESGELRIGERQKTGAPVIVNLRTNDFYQRKPPGRGSVASGAPAAFVSAIPRAFRDTLPARADRFKDRETAPREAPAFAYADVEDWLKAEPAVRRALMQRWRAKASEAPFRAALVANLSSHPEWDPILFPEKYRPKDPEPPRQDPFARAASAPAR
jgi:hypothetical protein